MGSGAFGGCAGDISALSLSLSWFVSIPLLKMHCLLLLHEGLHDRFGAIKESLDGVDSQNATVCVNAALDLNKEIINVIDESFN